VSGIEGTRHGSERDPRELDGAWVRHQNIDFPEPAPDLAPFFERYWAVDWDYATPYRQKIVPMPNVQVTTVPGGVPEVHGVCTGFQVKVLSGRGRVVGAAVRPGAFRAFLDGPVAALTDRTVRADSLPALDGSPEEPVTTGALERWLRRHLPAPGPDSGAREACDAVALVAADPSIARVDQLATATASSVRRLQRLFAEHVGVAPKWVIRRYRLREVTERMAAGGRVEWAAVAADLGYADQAHLVRDFTALFGEPPTHYARRYPPTSVQMPVSGKPPSGRHTS
jgi:AraC-like DNA-binding protein